MARGAISYRPSRPGRDVVMHDVVSLVPAQPSDIAQQLRKAAGHRPYQPFALLVEGLVMAISRPPPSTPQPARHVRDAPHL
ncbi:hypothetical protein FXF51_41260 [Nonomuraea sp. PA05]|uniref:hypothetical protein n=1 Tax=Nonomuraea sp. PA05 TaxID=2604466 RepID=UPI0011D56ECD|nr:hypothetical protein [Nonomuraea sp. PA05]TYB57250.1 hypothetical protein FXF51_41260 [Nonomuraea sp. PA05]